MWLQRYVLSYLENLSQCIGSTKRHLKGFFYPHTNFSWRRLQIFWAILTLFGVTVSAYLIILFLRSPPLSTAPLHKNIGKPTVIESGYTKTGSEGAWRYSIENSLKTLTETLSSLEVKLGELSKKKEHEDDDASQAIERRLSDLESQLIEKRIKDEVPFQSEPQATPIDRVESTIKKFTLTLSNVKSLKTVDTTISAGMFAKTVLLSGLDASAAMNASSDPRPMLLRLIDHGTLPRKFQGDLKDCHCTASAFGDISSERIYARLEKLSCIDRMTGAIIETQVAGYIAGPDGKAGIRGTVASKDGQFLTRSLMGGIFSGLSNVANPQTRRGSSNPFSLGTASVSPISLGEQFTSGMASGASSALDRLSQYYIDRAEQLQPVIQVAAGQIVDIVFTEGTSFGTDSVQHDLQKFRDNNQSYALSQREGVQP